MESSLQGEDERSASGEKLHLRSAGLVNAKSGVQSSERRLRKELLRLQKQVAIKPAFELGPFVHWKNNKSEPIHRWFKYREAYSPALIDRLSLGDRILDPFSGCGSILVGSATRRKRSLGIDLNPIAAFSSAVKLSPLAERQLSKAARFCGSVDEWVRHPAVWPVPELSIAQKVFEPEILEALLRLRAGIHDYASRDEQLRNFLLLAWLSILEAVGSYFKEGNGIKYRNKQRQIGRYSNRPDGEWQRTRFGTNQLQFVSNAYRSQLSMMLADAACWRSGNWAEQKVVQESAFRLAEIAGRRQFDSIVFSPPYANRFDYFESFKVELWFGGFTNSYEELSTLRKSSMRSHLGADLRRPVADFSELEEFIALMDQSASSWRMGVPQLLRGYFDDLRSVLRQCRTVAPKGKTFVVVGNSAFAGVVVPTDLLTALLARAVGFKSVSILETRHLTVAPQQRNRLFGFEGFMRESIVVCE